MKKLILVCSLVIFLSLSASATFDYIGVNEKYGKAIEKNYEGVINEMVPDSELLEVSCFIWEDHISLTATVDNTTNDNRAAVLIASLWTYIYLYNDIGFPDKAEISVNKPGGPIGSQLAYATVYSKWVEDYNEEAKINKTDAQKKIIGKFADTAGGY